MPFIRLSDSYIDHDKFLALSHAAFRLWHEGMAYCRKHQTDGRLASATVQGFRYYRAARVSELATAAVPGANPLWERIEGYGYQVHDYLFWNLSKDEEQADRDGATKRMRALRQRRRDGERSPDVQDRIGSSKSSFSERERERKPLSRDPDSLDVGERAGRLIEQYAKWYTELRHGAKLRLVGSPLEFQDACSLCETWDDERLEKLARIVLTTDDEFVTKTDRSFKIFSLKASWADDRLRQWEQENQVAV